MDELFIGSAVCKVSRRGDLMLPTPFRRTARVRAGVPDVRLFADMDGTGCLTIRDRAGLTRAYRAAEAATAPLGTSARDSERRRLLAFAAQIDVQPNGQLTLPAAARARARIGEHALLVATGDQFEIWDLARAIACDEDLARLAGLHLNHDRNDGNDDEIVMSPARPQRRAARGGKSRLPVQSLPPLPVRHDPLDGLSLQ